MFHDSTDEKVQEHFEISVRFRQMIEQRIARLESDAALDESTVTTLVNDDHIRRQLRLITAQRAEANRMRRFLENCSQRVPR